VYTSYFGNVKTIATRVDLRPIGIAVGVPRWWKGPNERRLAPTRAMLKLSDADYDTHFDAILAALDPAELHASLGDNAVLLCWEAPLIGCHRRRVAEWFEKALGVVVPELGYDRATYPAYKNMPAKTAKVIKSPRADAARGRGRSPEGGANNLSLFEL
jgi:hypothetical protein